MISAIYPRAPMNPDSMMCESLTSYISRSAVAHNLSVHSFMTMLNDLGPTHANRTSVRLIYDDGRAINSYGSSQKQYLGTLVRLTGVTDLRHCTLGALGESLASNGMGAVKKNRHWCEACFFEARRNETEAYDSLIWQMPELYTCPLHLVALVDKCYKCGSRQPAIPRAGGLDICIECCEPLGQASAQCLDVTSDTSAGAYQHWLVRQISELLKQRETLRLTLTGSELRSFFQELRKTWNLPFSDLAVQASLPQYSIETWASGRSQPKLETLLRVCANLNVSPAEVLIDPIKAASQLKLHIDLGNR